MILTEDSLALVDNTKIIRSCMPTKSLFFNVPRSYLVGNTEVRKLFSNLAVDF